MCERMYEFTMRGTQEAKKGRGQIRKEGVGRRETGAVEMRRRDDGE